MNRDTLSEGDVIIASFPRQLPSGREQQGYRPAIVVGLPSRIGTPRFPMILAIPLTTYREQVWAIASPKLYPVLDKGVANLPSASIALLDQLRALDRARIERYLGSLPITSYRTLRSELLRLLA